MRDKEYHKICIEKINRGISYERTLKIYWSRNYLGEIDRKICASWNYVENDAKFMRVPRLKCAA